MVRQVLLHLLDSPLERCKRAPSALRRQRGQVLVYHQLLLHRTEPTKHVPGSVLQRSLRLPGFPPRDSPRRQAPLLVTLALVRTLEHRRRRAQRLPQLGERPRPREQPLPLLARETRSRACRRRHGGPVIPIPIPVQGDGHRAQPGARVLLAILDDARIEAIAHLEELHVVCAAQQSPDPASVRNFEGVHGAQFAGEDALDPPLHNIIAQRVVFAKESNFEDPLHPRRGAIAKVILRLRITVEAREYIVQSVDGPELNRCEMILVRHFCNRQKPVHVRCRGVVYLELLRPESKKAIWPPENIRVGMW